LIISISSTCFGLYDAVCWYLGTSRQHRRCNLPQAANTV